MPWSWTRDRRGRPRLSGDTYEHFVRVNLDAILSDHDHDDDWCDTDDSGGGDCCGVEPACPHVAERCRWYDVDDRRDVLLLALERSDPDWHRHDCDGLG